MSPRHHPSVDVLAAYASGTLESGFGLVVGTHVEGCAECRRQVSQLQALSGEALRALPQAEMAGDALARVMARLDDAPVPAARIETDRRPLLDRLPLKPRKWITPGVWVAAVDTPHDADNRVYVLSVAPGWPTARHEHTGAEFCTVLKGAFRDEIGLFQAGDFAATEGELNHQPIVQGDEACVCLFATEGRLKPQGLLGRLAFGYANV
ncbi:MAG: ChrR family anti-sigma-E factor [Hyphomonadaceae bacterium]|nr:ChrR family anti-sigma-E factor [Hyphomonadaceae bacterium]